MKKFLSVIFIFIGIFSLFFWLNKASSTKNKLRIYTYSSFLSHYGPGPVLKKQFEKNCECEVEFVDAGDAGLILQRMSLNPEDHVDLVIGLDHLTINKALENQLWTQHQVDDVKFSQDFLIATEYFLPYDWSPMTFIYRKDEVPSPPRQLTDLTRPEFNKKFLFQDPRSSTPGQQFLFWSLREYGEVEGFKVTKKLLSNIKRLSPSWSAAYGYFQQKKASLVFSYLTSLIYHWKEGKDYNYNAVVFDHPHPVQVEYLAIPKKCINCNLARKFSKFMLSVNGQQTIAEKNYMFPVIDGVDLGKEYSQLPKLQTYKLKSYDDYQEKFHIYIKEWETLIRQ